MNRYLNIPYVNGGRDMQGLDCWGLVRLARHDLFGLDLLPLLNDLDADDKRSVTKQFYSVSTGFVRVAPMPGAIACGFIGKVCVHVGLVVNADGRLRVLETEDPHGVSCTPLAAFESRFTEVQYYDN